MISADITRKNKSGYPELWIRQDFRSGYWMPIQSSPFPDIPFSRKRSPLTPQKRMDFGLDFWRIQLQESLKSQKIWIRQDFRGWILNP